MKPRQLGSSDLSVGPIAYGCWRLAGSTVDDARRKIETALSCGMNLIDTADIYGFDGSTGFGSAEALLGRVLAADPSLRDSMVLATKGGIVPGVPYDSSPRYLREACEGSMRRLGVEVIDLYQVHRPDLLAHPAEVAEALIDLRASGKVREIGVSNYSPTQLAALEAHLGSTPMATIQPELSLLHLDPIDDGTLDFAMTRGLTPLIWSPLAGGRIPKGDVSPALRDVLERLSQREGVNPAVIALAFVMAHPSGPIPIIGTQQVDRIGELARAPQIELSPTDWYALAAAAGKLLP